MPTVDGTEFNRGRPDAFDRNKWQAGQYGGGGSAGGRQEARWRKAISQAVTDEAVVEVIESLQAAAAGKFNEDHSPDVAAARLFLEVLQLIGKERQAEPLISPDALKQAPDEVIEFLAKNLVS